MLWCFKIPAVVQKMPQASFLLTRWAAKLCFSSQLSLGVENNWRGEEFRVTGVTCVTEGAVDMAALKIDAFNGCLMCCIYY